MSPNNTNRNPPRFYTVAETATMFRVSPMTIYRAVEANELPAIRMRTRILIPAQAIDQMATEALTNHEPHATAPPR